MKTILTCNLSRAIALEQFAEDSGAFIRADGVLFFEFIIEDLYFPICQTY